MKKEKRKSKIKITTESLNETEKDDARKISKLKVLLNKVKKGFSFMLSWGL